MKSICYFGINDRRFKAFRENDETVFSVETRKPIAFVNEHTWFDWKTHKPIAVEEDDLVYAWETHKPILVISVE